MGEAARPLRPGNGGANGEDGMDTDVPASRILEKTPERQEPVNISDDQVAEYVLRALEKITAKPGRGKKLSELDNAEKFRQRLLKGFERAQIPENEQGIHSALYEKIKSFTPVDWERFYRSNIINELLEDYPEEPILDEDDQETLEKKKK